MKSGTLSSQTLARVVREAVEVMLAPFMFAGQSRGLPLWDVQTPSSG